MLLSWLNRIIVLFLSFVSIDISIYGESNYILCIEGGGSKTILQVLDHEGQVLSLLSNEVKREKIETSGSNINIVGVEGVKAVLRTLLEDIKIGDGSFLVDILPNCQVVAGMAGAGLPKNKQKIISLFEEWGLSGSKIHVMSDAELALKLIDRRGIILISGTGSICLGKKGQALFRVGGLGRILGDEGSGYQIGLEAFKAALAEEYGWGSSTKLTTALKEFYHVEELKNLIPQINLGEMSSSKIASCAPLVFNKAWEKDVLAEEIINRAAHDLGNLLETQLKISHLSDCEVHLWGGIFKSPHADVFIQKMMENISIKDRKLRVINHAHQNSAVVFASRFLLPN